MPADDAIRVLIVDDHPMFREGLRVALSTLVDVEVVGEAGDGAAAVAAALDLQPDVVVMDLAMPELLGVEATRRIVATSPHIGVLVLTMFDEDSSVFAAMRAGARGYLLKGSDQTTIALAIRAVARGEVILGPRVAAYVQQFFSAPRPSSAFPGLTTRELEVLEFVAQGRSNGDIARALVLSDKTVRNHISNIFAKLQVADRSTAIVRAREAGLGEQLA